MSVYSNYQSAGHTVRVIPGLAWRVWVVALLLIGSLAKAASLPDEAVGKMENLLQLSSARLAVAQDVAKAKWNAHAAIADPVREAAVVDDFLARARMVQLDERIARRFIEAQIEANKLVQQAWFDEWTLARVGKFDRVPDLANDVRPVLDRLTPQLLAALADVAPLAAKPGMEQFMAQWRQIKYATFPWPHALDVALAGIPGANMENSPGPK